MANAPRDDEDVIGKGLAQVGRALQLVTETGESLDSLFRKDIDDDGNPIEDQDGSDSHGRGATKDQ
jgi:hypothetical protein